MCYSAMIQAAYQEFVRHHGVVMSLEDLAMNVWAAPDNAKKRKRPKAMEDWLRTSDEPRAQDIGADILRQRAELELEMQEELFKQKRRQADAEPALATKVTRKAEADRRTSTDKISKLKLYLDDVQRNLDAWLTPEGCRLGEISRILDERPEVEYQHRVAAAA